MYQVIQGDTDVSGKLSQLEVSKTLDFCFSALANEDGSHKQQVGQNDAEVVSGKVDVNTVLSPDQIRLLDTIRGRWEQFQDQPESARVQMQTRITQQNINRALEEFGADVINGLTPRLQRGCLGLTVPSTEARPIVSMSHKVGGLDSDQEVHHAVAQLASGN
jgi:hypothetical protein